MTPEMTKQFEAAFSDTLRRTMAEFQPDLVLCHHLYLLTAIVREQVTDIPVYGFCHNTDLRQMKKHDLEKDRIAAAIRSLDRIFVLRSDQMAEVAEIYDADTAKMTAVGMGYNRDVFHPAENMDRLDKGITATQLVFAGKITQKKGVLSLVRSLQWLDVPRDSLKLICAGGAGNEAEYRQITDLAKTSRYPIIFPGRMEQTKLADIYRESDIFVLPSFYEGIPLTVIEALACGCRVVVSDLPGVKDWLDEFVPGADIRYVTLPRLQNADEPLPEDLPAFEERLTKAINDSIHSGPSARADVSRISWERIAQMVTAV